jgi:hypothetical protein
MLNVQMAEVRQLLNDCTKYFIRHLFYSVNKMSGWNIFYLVRMTVIVNLPVGYGLFGGLKLAAIFLSHDTTIVTLVSVVAVVKVSKSDVTAVGSLLHN